MVRRRSVLVGSRGPADPRFVLSAALGEAALAHSQFETIHPFADGNGRTGRTLIQLVLRRRGVATRVQPPVSLVLATRADAYVHALDGTRSDAPGTEGLLDWVELFLSATGRACADTEHFAAQLATWQQDARARLGKVRADSAALLLLDALPSLPVFSITTAAVHIGRTFKSTSDAVERLRAADVVRKVTPGRRNRAFEAVGLFEAFTGFERLLASPDAGGPRGLPSAGVRLVRHRCRLTRSREGPSDCATDGGATSGPGCPSLRLDLLPSHARSVPSRCCAAGAIRL